MKKLQKINMLKTLGLLSLVLLLASCEPEEEPTAQMDNMDDEMSMDDNGTTEQAPGFSLTSLEDGTISLSDYQDKVVVLFFFGYSCPICLGSAPTIESQIAQAYGSDANFVILGLDQWDGNEAGVQSFKDNTGVTFPLLMQASGTASNYSTTYDRLIIVDQNGNIAYKDNTSSSSSMNAVVNKLDELLK